MPRMRVIAALRIRLREDSCARPGPARRGETPPPSQRMRPRKTCKRDSARLGIGAGSPRCVEETVDYAARGSREGTACRRTVGVAGHRRTSVIEKPVLGGGGVSHRRSRAGRTVSLTDVATNTSVPRALAREAGRGERTAAPCPRPAGRRILDATNDWRRTWWAAY